MSQIDLPLRWAIIGVGRAGRARARAIQRDPRSTLVAVHRGKHAEATGAPILPLDEAMEAADAVAICTPNDTHVALAEAVLMAGKHVLVEFPLAPSSDEARHLFSLADRANRVLHVEHIELLHAPQRILRSHARPELQQRMTMNFERQGSGDEDAATILGTNISRLHRLMDIGGPIASIEEIDISPGRVRASFTFRSGIPGSLDFQAGPYFSRQTQFVVDATRHVWKLHNDALYRGRSPLTTLEATPLFQQDQLAATAQILKEKAHYVDRERIFHALDVAKIIASGTLGSVPSGAA